MSRAISAKTATERANILIAEMRRQARRSSTTITREMENALEMGDGEQVIGIIKKRILEGKLDRGLVARFLRLENPTKKRTLSVPERHQLKVALDTLKMNDVMARVMGGPSKEEARVIVKRLTGKESKENPAYLEIGRGGKRGQQGFGLGIGYRRRENPRGKRKKNPALLSVKSVGSNMTEVDHGSIYILYSYETPVAIYPREGVDSKPLITEKKWSTTTSKHIGVWLRSHGLDPKNAERLPQDMIDEIAKRGYYAKRPRENPGRGKVVGHFGSPRKIARAKYGKTLRRQSHESAWQFRLRQAAHDRGKTLSNPRRPLRGRGKKRTVGRRKNPLIGVLGNPPHDGKYLGKVTYIEYTHGHDGQKYYHDFKPPVYAQVTDDGGVKLWHPTEKLWKLFPEPK